MSFFKDFKDDLSQAVNELMPEDKQKHVEAKKEPEVSVAPATPVAPVVEEAAPVQEAVPVQEAAPVQPVAPVQVAAPVITPVITPGPAEDKIQEPVFAKEEPVKEEIKIPVYAEAPSPAPSAVEPIFAPEPEKAVVNEPVTPVFAVKDEVPEEVKEPVAPIFAPEPPKTVEVKAPVTPVFAPEPEEQPKPINTLNDASLETGVIPKGMIINGDIISSGSLNVVGTVKGNITIEGKLVVTGTIEGDSKADEVLADGAKIIGEITSEYSVNIGENSVIKGNIKATSATLAGAVKGDIDVPGAVVLDSTAVIMGNIKSKSLQINNGAAIEGLCSQCYADANRASVFDD